MKSSLAIHICHYVCPRFGEYNDLDRAQGGGVSNLQLKKIIFTSARYLVNHRYTPILASNPRPLSLAHRKRGKYEDPEEEGLVTG